MNRPTPPIDPLVKSAVRISLAGITHVRTTLEQLGDLARVHPPVVAVLRDYRETLASLLDGGDDAA